MLLLCCVESVTLKNPHVSSLATDTVSCVHTVLALYGNIFLKKLNIEKNM